MAERRRRNRARRAAVAAGGVLALALAAGGVAVAAAREGTTDRYRTAAAELAAVEQTLAVTGTVASAGRRDLAFSVAGTVASVDVAVGDTVTAGQRLATLDLEELQDAVDVAEEQLADAEQQLEDDLESQTTTTTASTTTGTTAGATAGTGAATGGTGTAGGSSGSTGGGTPTSDDSGADDPAVVAAVAAVTAAQEALLAAHGSAGEALTASRAALAAATDVTCAALLTDATGGTDAAEAAGTGTETEAGTEAGTETGTDPETDPADPTTPDPSAEDVAACRDALSGVLTAQEAVAAAQDEVSALAAELDAAVTALQDAWRAASGGTSDGADGSGSEPDPSGSDSSGSATGSSSAAADAAQAGTAQAGSASAGTPSGGTAAVATAADVLADQAAIDAAEAQVAIAADALARNELTAPVSGTVAAVALAVGDTVTASSATAVITVLGDAGYLVETTVALGQVDELAVGQPVTATVSSTDTELTGAIASIGVLAASSTSSEPTYPVVIALDPVDAWLWEGSSADVVIEVGASAETLTVPTSAVHTSGGVTTVQVLDGDEVTDVEVTVGTVGVELTEVLDGLTEGAQVVLADLTEPMTTDEATETGLTGLGAEEESQTPTMPGGFQPPTGGGGPPAG